jgi:hypothetical protein
MSYMASMIANITPARLEKLLNSTPEPTEDAAPDNNETTAAPADDTLEDGIDMTMTRASVGVGMEDLGADPEKYHLVRDAIARGLLDTYWFQSTNWSNWAGSDDVRRLTLGMDKLACENRIEVSASPVWFGASYVQLFVRRSFGRPPADLLAIWKKHHLQEKFLTSCQAYTDMIARHVEVSDVPEEVQTD